MIPDEMLLAGLPARDVSLVHDCLGSLHWELKVEGDRRQLICILRAHALGTGRPVVGELPENLPQSVPAILAMMSIVENQIIHQANFRIRGY